MSNISNDDLKFIADSLKIKVFGTFEGWSIFAINGDIFRWRPDKNIEQAWDIEEKIKNLGYEHRKKYQDCLIDIIESEIDSADLIGNLYFFVAHATPLQKCKATIKSIKSFK